MLSTDTARSGVTPPISVYRNEVRSSEDHQADARAYRGHYKASVNVHIEDASGREYPTQIEIEHVNIVQKLLVYVGVSDVRHARELQEDRGKVIDQSQLWVVRLCLEMRLDRPCLLPTCIDGKHEAHKQESDQVTNMRKLHHPAT